MVLWIRLHDAAVDDFGAEYGGQVLNAGVRLVRVYVLNVHHFGSPCGSELR